MQTHYEILGVTPDSERSIIKKAYNEKAILYHPDKQALGQTEEQLAESTAKFRAVQEAWETLQDPCKRLIYDRRIGSSSGRPAGPQPPPQAHAQHRDPARTQSGFQSFCQPRPQPRPGFPPHLEHYRPKYRNGWIVGSNLEWGLALNDLSHKSRLHSPGHLASQADRYEGRYNETGSRIELMYARLYAFYAAEADFRESEFLGRVEPGAERSSEGDYKQWTLEAYIASHKQEWERVKAEVQKLTDKERAQDMRWKLEEWAGDCDIPVLNARYLLRAKAYGFQYKVLANCRRWD